jgi:precorrin-2/cobalt-factor-2 C20-methyltransferase
MNQLGKLYGISIGTGDPELITVKGLKLLQNAPVVAFPAGIAGKKGIAQQIIAPWLQSQQIQLPLDFPYIHDEEELKQAWIIAAKTVYEYLHQGKDVAFACEGDVSFYSTFTYLAQTLGELHPSVEIQTIPGVSSPLAIASVLGIPLTVKDQKLVILPALYHVEELEKVLQWADIIVLMKVSSVYEKVWKILKKYDCLNNSWIVEKATLPDQKIYKELNNYPTLDLSYFSLLIIAVSHFSNQ